MAEIKTKTDKITVKTGAWFYASCSLLEPYKFARGNGYFQKKLVDWLKDNNPGKIGRDDYVILEEGGTDIIVPDGAHSVAYIILPKLEGQAISQEELAIIVNSDLRVESIEGPQEVLPGGEGEFRVSGYNETDVDETERKAVLWEIEAGGKEEDIKEQGEKIKLAIKNEWAGQEITVKAYINRRESGAIWKTKVVKWELPRDFINSLRCIRTSFPVDENNKPVLVYEKDQVPSEDLIHGDKTDEEVLDISNLFSDEIESSKFREESLFDNMRLLGGTTSIIGGRQAQENTTALINHFKGNTGSDFSSSFLDEALSDALDEDNEDNFLYSRAGVVKRFEEELKKHNGNINNIDTLDPKSLDMKRVQFNKKPDRWNGKKFAVNDTHAFKVKVTDYELLPNNRYNATFNIVYYDHFGLDMSDVKKYIVLAGFRCWYYLQHVRNYKPFITVFQCDKHIRNRNF
jgi:hypothetical protein